MKKPEDMTRDELIGAVWAYRRILFPKPRKCLDPELHEIRPCDCPQKETDHA